MVLASGLVGGLRFRAKTDKNARNGLKIDRCRIGVQASRFGV